MSPDGGPELVEASTLLLTQRLRRSRPSRTSSRGSPSRAIARRFGSVPSAHLRPNRARAATTTATRPLHGRRCCRRPSSSGRASDDGKQPTTVSSRTTSGHDLEWLAGCGEDDRGPAVARLGRLAAGRSKDGRVVRGRPSTGVAATHAEGDRSDDAEPDQHIADAEDVRERQPGRQREDVGQRPQRGISRTALFENPSTARAGRGQGRRRRSASRRRWPRSPRG